GLAHALSLLVSSARLVCADRSAGTLEAHQERAKTPGNRTENAAKEHEGKRSLRGYRGRMRLLVVEDEPDLVGALRTGLSRAGYAVDTALTVDAALEKLATTEYDLLLLDIALPDTDGLTLCRMVRKGEIPVAAGPDLRILMLTAR